MNTFVEYPLTKQCLANRSLIYGIGINDAPYKTRYRENDKYLRCPYYTAWCGMLTRCYSHKYHLKQSTYRNSTVCHEWLTFINFKLWMQTQPWENNALDKDIIQPNNQLYSPNTCCFIPQSLNNILGSHEKARGRYPQGVSFHRSNQKYKARISINNKSVHLGLYKTIQEAETAYKKAKQNILIKAAYNQTNPKLTKGLLLHAAIFS